MSALAAQTTPRLNHINCTSSAGAHRMAYWEWGDPTNTRILLCVHGLTRTGRDFDTLAQALSSDYRVVCPDIAGRGESDWLSNSDDYAIAQYIADVFTLINHLQPTSLDWVGTSMGGIIGMAIAAKLSRSSIPLRRVVLNDIGPVINPEGLARIGGYIDDELVFDSFAEAVEQAKVRWHDFGEHSQAQWEHLARYVFKQQGGRWVQAYDLAIAEPFKKQFLGQTEGQKRASAQKSESSLWRGFEHLPAEVLIIHGQQSDLLSAAAVQKMLAANPKAELCDVPKVGHAPTLMHTDQIQAVKHFLLQE